MSNPWHTSVLCEIYHALRQTNFAQSVIYVVLVIRRLAFRQRGIWRGIGSVRRSRSLLRSRIEEYDLVVEGFVCCSQRGVVDGEIPELRGDDGERFVGDHIISYLVPDTTFFHYYFDMKYIQPSINREIGLFFF